LHITLLAAGARAGSNVVAAFDLYGATFSLLRSLLAELNISTRFVDATNHSDVEAALIETRASILLVETISNPLLKIADVPFLAELAHRLKAQLLVDNTFASPFLFNPLAQGADFSIHSATKYLGGHGDVMAGVVATSSENRQKMYELNKLVGSVLGPYEAWLALRGLKTLPLRVRQQCQNASMLAKWLQGHPKVQRVNYPGLESHPQHSLAGRLFEGRGYGGVLSFEIAGARKEEVFHFMEALELCLPAATLGDIYTLVLHPATSSHRGLTSAERSEIGIPDGLVRISAGIEAGEDILADLEQALDKI